MMLPDESDEIAEETDDDEATGPIPDQPRARGDLPSLAERIQEAQRQARQRRVEQGLPPDADDGAYTARPARKHAANRSKKHGQFLGTACDTWQPGKRR